MSLGPRFQKLSFSRTSFRQEYLNRNAIRNIFKEKILPEITLFACAMTALGSMILAFGLYHVHAYSGITEGGVLGLVLLLQYWLDLSPALSGPVINTACFVLGWKVLGCRFVIYSALASLAFSLAWAGCELMDPLWPDLADHPLVAALAGALFVGVGCGLCIRTGGATGGDDALAMALTEITKIRIQWIYLLTDLSVLALSACYIPLERLFYSLITVLLSGQLIGFICEVRLPWRRESLSAAS